MSKEEEKLMWNNSWLLEEEMPQELAILD